MRLPVSKSLLALALTAGLAPSSLLAEKKQPATAPAPAAHPNVPPPRGNNPNKPNPNNPNHPPVRMPDTAVGRFMSMNPQQREKALSKLPPEQQKRIRDRIDAFKQLPKEEQQKQLADLERFNQLPPAQKQTIRKDFQQFHSLPPDRKQAVYRELNHVGKMTDEQRTQYFQSEQFHNRFSPEEQEMVQNLSLIPQK